MVATWLPAAIRLGLLERIDAAIVNRTGCIPQAQSEYAVGVSVNASGIGFTSNRLGSRVPRTWSQFWDTVGWPGRRGSIRRVTNTLEMALLADGVPPAAVYPCDVDRAFRALNRLKPAVNH
jgi:putative spermidine/putrescine transport system substrate-binding protein